MPIDLRAQARDRLIRERGAIEPKQAEVRIALVFPNTYPLGMASLGFQLVYRMLNQLPNAVCERAFLPNENEIAEHLRTGTELFTLETQTPISRFDAIAFSISFELDYLNVLRILRLANVPLLAAERDERHPLIIAGGICPTFNPEPLADFIDAFVIGDAEPVLPELINALDRSSGRSETLQNLTGIPGVYVPVLGGKVERAIALDLNQYPYSSLITTPEAEFGEIELVEVARGCARACKFCVAGRVTSPPRPRTHIQLSGDRRYGLVGAAVFDHPHAVDLCRRIVERGGQFNVSSLRLETVSREVAQLLASGGQKTLTIAPEAGSPRLRRLIGKNTSEQSILASIANALEAGINRVKLYFMIGLPTETDDDALEIAALVHRLAEAFPKLHIQVSISCFVPKPWTAFQREPMEREEVLKRRISALRKSLSKLPRIRLAVESPRLAQIQALLARGDRQLGQFLIAALDSDGDYRAAVRASGIDLENYLHRPRSKDEILPWEYIDARLT